MMTMTTTTMIAHFPEQVVRSDPFVNAKLKKDDLVAVVVSVLDSSHLPRYLQNERSLLWMMTIRMM